MQSGVCFGAGALWQGGACCCTSVSELSDLCRVGGVGQGLEAAQLRHVRPREGAIWVMSWLLGHPTLYTISLFLPLSPRNSSTPPPPRPPRPSTQCFWLLQAVPCCITSALHVSVLYIFPLISSPRPPVVAFMAPYLFYYNSNCHYYFSCPPSPSD